MYSEDKERLAALVATENYRIQEVFSIWSQIENKEQVMRDALTSVLSRGAVLRLLVCLGDDIKKLLFADLVELASVGHSDIALVRAVVKSLPRKWLLETIDLEANAVLDRTGDEETYRRMAELLADIDEELLASIVTRARESENADVREVANDFGKRLDE